MYLEMDEISMVPVMVVRGTGHVGGGQEQAEGGDQSGNLRRFASPEDGLSYEVVDLPLPRAWTPELREPEPPPGPSPEAKEKQEILARLQATGRQMGLDALPLWPRPAARA